MSALVRWLFPKSNIAVDLDCNKKSKKIYDKNEYLKILNKSYKDILLSEDEISFLETIPRKKFNIILNINRINRTFDKQDYLSR